MAEVRPLVDLDPKPIPVPPRPVILSIDPAQLFGAGGAGEQTLCIAVDTALPDVVAHLDGVTLPSEAKLSTASPTLNRGSVKAIVSMAGLTPGLHLVSLIDGNGASLADVQVSAHAA